MARRTVYLAGPMRGIPHWNFPAFARAKAQWEAVGWRVFCPATVATALGYGDTNGPAEPDGGEGLLHLRHVLLSDVLCLSNATALALLQGWEHSRGATFELATAQFLGLEIYNAETMERINPLTRPWSKLEKVHASQNAQRQLSVPRASLWNPLGVYPDQRDG